MAGIIGYADWRDARAALGGVFATDYAVHLELGARHFGRADFAWLTFPAPGCSPHHTGYEQPFGATIYRDILVLEDGPVVIRDRVVGGEGHEAQWGFHTPLDVTPSDSRTVRLRGNVQYTLAEAHPEDITRLSTARHWAASR